MSTIGIQTLGDADERAIEVLLTEIRRYLALVAVLRADGREPRWR
jgi:hypothetical protein